VQIQKKTQNLKLWSDQKMVILQNKKRKSTKKPERDHESLFAVNITHLLGSADNIIDSE
jgi:hypothetical protein